MNMKMNTGKRNAAAVTCWNFRHFYRSMIYSSADVVGELEEQIQAIQSDIRIQKVKLNKLNLDLHWSHVSNRDFISTKLILSIWSDLTG